MKAPKIVLCLITMFLLACGALLAVTPYANASATLNSNESLVALSAVPMPGNVATSSCCYDVVTGAQAKYGGLSCASSSTPSVAIVPAIYADPVLPAAIVPKSASTVPKPAVNVAAISSNNIASGSAMITPDTAACTGVTKSKFLNSAILSHTV